MTKNRNRGKEAEIILMIIVFSAVFLMTCLTPMLADDFSYSFSYADNRRIENIGDIIRSLCENGVQFCECSQCGAFAFPLS